jgi:hypothetical protein
LRNAPKNGVAALTDDTSTKNAITAIPAHATNTLTGQRSVQLGRGVYASSVRRTDGRE